MRPPKLFIVGALAVLSILFVLFRARSDEPSPEPVQSLSKIMDWSSFEESISRTFHVECKGLCFGALDAFYILPNQDALDRVEKFRRRFCDGGPYLDEAKDCDDFAREATYLAKRWSYRYFDGVPASLAYGSAFVRVNGPYALFSKSRYQWFTGYHVINVYLRNDGQWFFFEPQSGLSEPVESMLYEGAVEVLRLDI